MVILTKDFVYIFEFKMDTSTDVAIKQIEDKEYAAPFLSDKRKLFKIGAVFSNESRKYKRLQSGIKLVETLIYLCYSLCVLIVKTKKQKHYRAL